VRDTMKRAPPCCTMARSLNSNGNPYMTGSESRSLQASTWLSTQSSATDRLLDLSSPVEPPGPPQRELQLQLPPILRSSSGPPATELQNMVADPFVIYVAGSSSLPRLNSQVWGRDYHRYEARSRPETSVSGKGESGSGPTRESPRSFRIDARRRTPICYRYPSACNENSSEYNPSRTRSSLCEPTSQTVPFSRTTIRSAIRTVEKR
jgi:hypothetical protein